MAVPQAEFTTFGCEAAGAVAHADSGDCPSSVDTAADDPRWAADRLNSIKSEYVTTGLFYESDGNETTITSGEDSDADRVAEILRQVGAPFPSNDRHPAAAHVEAKVAARMRDNDITEGVLVINNPGGVCGGTFGCRRVLAKILPSGARLIVWSPPTIEQGTPNEFTGR